MAKTLISPLVVPEAIRRKAGLHPGEKVEFKVSARSITIVPKRDSAGEALTAAQRRTIDARLAKADQDTAAGRVHGPFTAKEASVFIERLAAERSARKAVRPRR